jgi:hypothetical protein
MHLCCIAPCCGQVGTSVISATLDTLVNRHGSGSGTPPVTKRDETTCTITWTGWHVTLEADQTSVIVSVCQAGRGYSGSR